jgi:predicted RND superfamily exporter protein
MANINQRIALGFENWTDFVFTHHKRVILVCVVLMAGFISQMPTLKVDTTVEGFLYPDDPAMVAYDQFRDQFGRDDRIVMGIQGGDVFSETFLQRLASFHQAIEARVPYLEEVESLINARNVYGTDDELVVDDLLAEWPETAEQLAALEKRALENPLYRNLILSADGDFTTVVVKMRRYSETLSDDQALDQFDFEEEPVDPEQTQPALLSEAENDEVIVALLEVIREYHDPGFQVYTAGQPVMAYTIKNTLIDDMRIFVALGLAAIAILLFLLFHTIWAVIPPLVVVICALISTLSCMAMSAVPVQIPTQILPSFLLAVGVADSVHIMTIFYHRLHSGEEKQTALRNAMGHAALPILFTSLTTAGGLCSFIGSGMAPVSNLGIFAPLGVMFALFYSVVLLPAVISLLPAASRTEDLF